MPNDKSPFLTSDTFHSYDIPGDTARGEYFSKKKYVPESLPKFADTRDKLPAPIIDGHPEWVEMYWRCWELPSSICILGEATISVRCEARANAGAPAKIAIQTDRPFELTVYKQGRESKFEIPIGGKVLEIS
jgi:hypothetical protein